MKAALFHSYHHHVLGTAQPDYTKRDSSINGVMRTLSRMDRAFINIPMTEARDFHCCSHVFENLGKRSIPSDHAAVRVVIQKTTTRGPQGNRIPSWMSKHPVFCSFLKRLDEEHQYLADPFGSLADFKIILEKARRQTVRELSRETPDSRGAKLLTASIALRASERSCDVVRCGNPLENDSTQSPSNASTSKGLVKLLRASLGKTLHLPWTQTEKDNAIAKCRLGLRAWRAKRLMLCLHAVTDEDGHPLENEDVSGRRLCDFGCTTFQAPIRKGPRHHQ